MCESVTCILLLQFIFPDNGALWYFLLLSDVFDLVSGTPNFDGTKQFNTYF